MHYRLLYQYTSCWLLLNKRNLMLISYANVDFLSRDGAANIQILGLLTRGQCRVSDTQVTIRPFDLSLICGILILQYNYRLHYLPLTHVLCRTQSHPTLCFYYYLFHFRTLKFALVIITLL